MSGWIICEYDDDGEIINPEWVDAPDDSFWWVNSLNKLDKVCRKDEIWFRPTKIARVAHPAQPQVPEASDKLAVQLIMIRELLKMCPQDCLGSGQRSDCAPWPIRDEVIDGINQALLSAQENTSPAPAVPEGYALVPIEPTTSMLFYASTINRPHDLCREIYRDMIAGHTHPESVLTASQEQEK